MFCLKPVEENKESPRIQEIDEDADNSPPIINDVDSDEEDSPEESKANPVNSSPIILDLDGSSRNPGQSNSQIVSSVKRGDDSRSEDTALTHHRLRVSWDNIESGKVRGPTDRRGLGFSGPPGKARDDKTPLGKQPFVASSTPTAVSSLPVLPPMIMVAAVSTSNENQGMGTGGPETVSEIHPSSVIETPFTEYPRHCLYVRDLVLCRKNGEGRYLVDSALTINTTLADTGAGPSVVTTTLLASLPDDACISREEQEQKLDAIAGPDGSPLIPRGHVSLVFSISGVPFRHRFLVIEGRDQRPETRNRRCRSISIKRCLHALPHAWTQCMLPRSPAGRLPRLTRWRNSPLPARRPPMEHVSHKSRRAPRRLQEARGRCALCGSDSSPPAS
eukprot:scaffold9550_cov111-Isochrysis_galbana.AAC.5